MDFLQYLFSFFFYRTFDCNYISSVIHGQFLLSDKGACQNHIFFKHPGVHLTIGNCLSNVIFKETVNISSHKSKEPVTKPCRIAKFAFV